MSDSSSDIISNLPCNLLEKILVGLTIQDAARTSVLSRKWRYIWTKLPQLVFNDRFCRGLRRATTNKLLLIIYNVLLLHRGPILKFTLNLTALESCPEIDPLISFVLNNGVQDFAFRTRKGGPSKLPSSLFSSLQLEQLNLGRCIIKPPLGFKGFTRLLSLVLFEVVITDDVFSSLISSCPLLEWLTVFSSTSLDCLEIVAPNLRFLSCEGPFRSISVKNSSHLAEVLVLLIGSKNKVEINEGELSNSVMLLGSVPVIELLELDYHYLRSLAAGDGVSESLPTTLAHLKILKLYAIRFGELDLVARALYLISSSPNLEELRIVACPVETTAIDPFLELLDVQGWSDMSLNQLRAVKILRVSGTRSELEFIKFLLAKSPMLETLLITPHSKELSEELRILKELTRFRRLSPQAEITFKSTDDVTV